MNCDNCNNIGNVNCRQCSLNINANQTAQDYILWEKINNKYDANSTK